MRFISQFFKGWLKDVSDGMDDRRHWKRYEALLQVDYLDPATNMQGKAITKNISKNGLRFPIEKEIPKGTILDMKIEDPHTHNRISSKAKVKWLEKFVAGDNAEDVTYEVGVKLLDRHLY